MTAAGQAGQAGQAGAQRRGAALPVPPHASGPAPDLLRLLRSWGLALPAVPPEGVAQRLAQGLGWMDAVALAQAMAAPALPSAGSSAPNWPALQSKAAEAVARCRGPLLAGFTDPALVREAAAPTASALDTVAPFRQHHQQQQRAMAARLTPLRAQLRDVLAGATPALAHLAQLDAVLDPALHEAQAQRLAGLPSMLLQRGLSLKAAETQRPDAPPPVAPPAWPPTGWRARLWAEQQQLLQAELALRWQPVQGLLDALHDAAPQTVPTPLLAPGH